MAKRNFSTLDYFIQRGKDAALSLHFRGGDVALWQQRLREQVMNLLGPFPQGVPLNPEVVWSVERDGILKEKVVFDSEEYASVPAYVLKRKDLGEGRHPAVLCLHGHGPEDDWHSDGKSLVAGEATTPKRREAISAYHYDYALELAKAGFITMTFDFRNFGERHDKNLYPGRDSCNVHFIRGMVMGIPLISLNLLDCMKAVDYLTQREDVSSGQLGCAGLSFGGTMALHVAAIDSRLKAVLAASSLTTYDEYAIKMGNFCGSQFIPGIYRYADLSDLAGLIAPRPLLIEHGVHDPGFPIEASQQAFSHLQQIYKAAAAEQKLVHDVFDGAHQYHGVSAADFFRRGLHVGEFVDGVG